MVIGRAGLPLIGTVADELAAEARQRELAAVWSLVGERAVADRLGAHVFHRERDGTVPPDQCAITGNAVQAGDGAAVVAIVNRGRTKGVVGQCVARHDVDAVADHHLALAVDAVVLAQRPQFGQPAIAVG